ncbi:hypothetical protein TWF225_012090 [Orbilia oligospora]|nr:hypothetical protein TWF751_000936 [Orbilia oligospora]KAF3186354.1 hypothetical protein TWF225_012090 [Orbilia oligospora]KAF3260679.1 hypothetical protein TWF128_012083 [Orbilia oligospora]KAF3293080.1 hypothetical protein TWF132_005072 [Orbilia oligospora]
MLYGETVRSWSARYSLRSHNFIFFKAETLNNIFVLKEKSARVNQKNISAWRFIFGRTCSSCDIIEEAMGQKIQKISLRGSGSLNLIYKGRDAENIFHWYHTSSISIILYRNISVLSL